jgi:hypothetical protein
LDATVEGTCVNKISTIVAIAAALEVRVGTIYRTHSRPGGNEWMWFLNGV